ncbi:CrcB family protein [Agromyces sp. LHK192]|uniref:fluoride efflux transporter FluC n=1 Tax=Agromyces sp. LHK192 TaxID=2498704 RepID=UPI000FDC4E08|nr:CrcB family protein [Agromyces sp. LHK192]
MRAILAVFVGGLIGTGLRFGLDLLLPHGDDAFPVSTLVANLAGALALGTLVGGLWTRPSTPAWVKAGAGAGLLGSFTTLSAVMASLVLLAGAGSWWTAGAYLAVSLIGGIGLAYAGLVLGARLVHGRVPPEAVEPGDPGRPGRGATT